ncbi:recombinase RecT [Rhizobium rhizogenes]|uniref:recombinase RecT n=1 Tax=Rhizobium rhizogenes TaxID=359 RepID=UPI0022C69DEB|nr:recombinase RecT [Rhizobium rhizogenes]MCZ7488224.1 recombinase RecT [Rhizobium rhizogenes]
MNQVTTQKNEGGLSYKNVTIAQTGGGGMLLPQTFGEVVAFATMMSRSQHAIPKHLRDNDGACMAITMQSLRWEMDPFMVASKSYNVKDLIAYEAQLVAAVVNTRAPIAKRPVYEYKGEGETRQCIVSCEMLDGSIKSYESPMLGKITTKNSPLWKSDPDQQLGYFSIRSWARRHTPEVILGVYTPDEAEQFSGPDNAKDVTPSQPSVMQRLRAAQETPQQPEEEREGFDAAFVHSETETALTGEILPNTNSDDEPPSPSSDNAGMTPVDEAGADDVPASDAPASTDPEREVLIRFAAEMLPMAATAPTEAWKEVEKGWSEGEMKTLSEDGKAKAKSISQSIRAIAAGNTSLESAAGFHSEMLDCKASDLGGVDD